MDVYEPGPGAQITDFNPGITPSGLFWTTALPPEDVDVDFESLLRALNRIGYDGPLSIEWEDAGMDREWGAQDALAFVRRSDFKPSEFVFDEAMRRSEHE